MSGIRRTAIALAAAAMVLSGCGRRSSADTLERETDHGREACVVEPDIVRLSDGREYRTPDYVPKVPAGMMTYSSKQPVIDALYAIEAAQQHFVTYDNTVPFSALVIPNDPEVRRAMASKDAGGAPDIPSTSDECAWPVSTQAMEWLMGQAEIVRASADKMAALRLKLLAQAALSDNARVRLDRPHHLLRGVPSYLLHPVADLPAWMGATERFMALSATSCLAYRAAMMIVKPDGCDTIKRHIVNTFWVPSLGGFSPMVYGASDGLYPIQLQATDNVASAIAVLTGATSTAMTAAIFNSAPITSAGVPVTYPSFDNSASMVPIVHAMWMAAAAKSSNRLAYEDASARIVADAVISEGRGEKSLTALIIRGLLGSEFTDEGLRFAPFVPRWLPGEKRIGNFHYGNATFDITLNGTGNYITTFTLDGEVSEPFIPATVTGRHEIAITLTGDPNDNNAIHLSDSLRMPPPPTVVWENEYRGKAQMHNPTRYDAQMTMYLNGVLLDGISDGTFSTPPAPDNFSSVQVVTTLEGHWSTFSAAPHVTYPPHDLQRINLLKLAKTGSRIIENKRLATRYVETGRWKNRQISFEFFAKEEGDYIFDIHYLNGLGIVNPTRKFGLRSLSIDGREEGTMYFPQLSPANWNHANDWQTQTGFSTAVVTHLDRGVHRATVSFYQPSAIQLDPDMNVVLMDYLRIIKK